jgi:hypothetical protein
MSVVVVSSTDTPEQVLAAQGGAKPVEESKEEVKAEAVAEEAEEAEGEESSEESEASEEPEAEEAKEEAKPKKKNGYKEKLIKARAALEAERAQTEKWRQEALKVSKPAEEKQVTAEGKPDPEKFESYADYLEALTDWKVEQREKDREAKARTERVQSEQQKVAETYKARVSEFEKTHDDFHEVIESSQVVAGPTLVAAILDSDMGPAIAYELAKNEEEFERINSLSPLAAAREIGKLEAKLKSAQEKPAAKTTTKAPAPISQVGKGSAKVAKDPDNMPYQEFKKWREEQSRR